MAVRGHQKQRFDARIELFVGQNERHFVFEIGDGAKTPHDELRVLLAREIDREARKRGGLDVCQLVLRNGLAQHFEALFDSKQRDFARVDAHANHYAAKNSRRFAHDVEMARGDRIESAGINCGCAVFCFQGLEVCRFYFFASNSPNQSSGAAAISCACFSPMKTYDAAVIGAGIAGLTGAALLARDGLNVITLESHDKVGGCAGYFDVPSKWGDFRFPTGATVALGLEKGGLHSEIFDLLGVSCPAIAIEKLAVFLPDTRLDLCHDPQKWRMERRKLPGNRAMQELFWRLQELIADAGWFALSRKPALPLQNFGDLKRDFALASPKLAPMIAALPFSVGELMKTLRIDRDKAFCALVNLQLLITTQSLSHAAPLGNGMAGLDLWRHGAFHPIGGVGSIANALLQGFQKHGGETRFGARVTGLKRENGVWEIETQSGEIVRARRVVANVPIGNLPKLLENRPESVQKAAQRGGRGWGAVTLYCAVREAAIPPDFPLHAQILSKYAATPPYLDAGAGDDVFLSLSQPGDECAAPPGFRALNVSTHARLGDWKNLSKLEYRAQKAAWRDKLLAGVRLALPDFDAGRGFVITGTPSTWESYTNRGAGSVGGVPLTRRNANLRALPSRFRGLPGFHLVGDTTVPGQGTVACALSGFNAFRDITG